MLSDLLGLTIDKGNLNKKSPSPVTSSLKKTATNYLAIGRMAEDLKLIRLNFSRWLAMEGVKVRGTPDMHMLKEDELSKKFGVMREKYFRSKVKLASADGTSGNKGWAKNLLEKYVGYKIGRKIERNLAAAVLKKYKKLTWIRKLVQLKKKIKVFINRILSKLNIKKMLADWIKQNYKKFIEPLVKHLASKLGFTTGLKAGLKGVATVALRGFVRMIPYVGVAIMIFEGLYAAWNSPPNSDIFKEFILGALDSFTLGLIGKENISPIYDKISEWHSILFTKMFDAIDRSFKFIEEKMTSFVDFIIKKSKSLFTVETRPADFESSFEKWNKQRLQEESKMFEEYSDYFDKMEKAISDKKIKIGKLQFEIASLEYSISAMVKGPEDARLQEAKIQKAKEEAEKTRLEEEVKKTREGGGPVEEKKKKPETPIPSKPSAAPTTTVVPSPTKKDESKYDEGPTKGAISSANEFVAKMYEPAKKAAAKLNVPVLGLLAQWATESGYGSKPSGDYNYFGLKSFGKPPQKLVTTTEVGLSKDAIEDYKKKGWFISQSGNKVKVKDLFKSYSSIDEAVMAQADFLLTNPRYAKAGVFGTKTPLEYGQALKKAGYATDSKYAETLSEVSKGVLKRLPETDKVQFAQNGEFLGPSAAGTKLAATEKPTTTASSGKFLKDESKQVAQAQREQMKPKDVNVAKVDKTNNVKQTNYQNVAMGKDTNPAETVTNRAA